MSLKNFYIYYQPYNNLMKFETFLCYMLLLLSMIVYSKYFKCVYIFTQTILLFMYYFYFTYRFESTIGKER